MENVVMTPHSSGSTAHYDERVIEIFLPNLETYLSGQEPTINRVNLELQY
jgi:phosphoglycerate dehydrogenase-like enzyme